jgi:hypothetical protein
VRVNAINLRLVKADSMGQQLDRSGGATVRATVLGGNLIAALQGLVALKECSSVIEPVLVEAGRKRSDIQVALYGYLLELALSR